MFTFLGLFFWSSSKTKESIKHTAGKRQELFQNSNTEYQFCILLHAYLTSWLLIPSIFVFNAHNWKQCYKWTKCIFYTSNKNLTDWIPDKLFKIRNTKLTFASQNPHISLIHSHCGQRLRRSFQPHRRIIKSTPNG